MFPVTPEASPSKGWPQNCPVVSPYSNKYYKEAKVPVDVILLSWSPGNPLMEILNRSTLCTDTRLEKTANCPQGLRLKNSSSNSPLTAGPKFSGWLQLVQVSSSLLVTKMSYPPNPLCPLEAK